MGNAVSCTECNQVASPKGWWKFLENIVRIAACPSKILAMSDEYVHITEKTVH